jgi:hypothetical protein
MALPAAPALSNNCRASPRVRIGPGTPVVYKNRPTVIAVRPQSMSPTFSRP